MSQNFCFYLITSSAELRTILPEASQGCVDKCVMLGKVPGVNEHIMKICDQSLVQQVPKDGVGTHMSYYIG